MKASNVVLLLPSNEVIRPLQRQNERLLVPNHHQTLTFFESTRKHQHGDKRPI